VLAYHAASRTKARVPCCGAFGRWARIGTPLCGFDPIRAKAEGHDRYLRETRPRGALTVGDIWTAYIDHLGRKPTAKTMGYTGRAILPHFGALRPDQITTDDCRSYLADRLKASRKIGSVHTELGHLRSAMKWAAKQGVIGRAPHIELPPKPDSDVQPLSDAQVRALIDGCAAPQFGWP